MLRLTVAVFLMKINIVSGTREGGETRMKIRNVSKEIFFEPLHNRYMSVLTTSKFLR